MPSIAEVERLTAERRKATARNARDTAVLARGTDVIKAVAYYQRAARFDPSDPKIWDEYARAALDAGRTDEAKAAFEQAALKAQESNNPRRRYWATLGHGDVAVAQGNLPAARELYAAAVAIADPIAKTDPGNAGWQRDLAVSHTKIGDVLRAQGNLPDALAAYKASLVSATSLKQLDEMVAKTRLKLSMDEVTALDATRA